MKQLPEAPASVTIKAFKNGYSLLFTIRDTEASELAKKMNTMIDYFQNNGITPDPIQQTIKPVMEEPIPENWCPIHQVEMTKYSKEGRSWYSHRLDDGTWCKGK